MTESYEKHIIIPENEAGKAGYDSSILEPEMRERWAAVGLFTAEDFSERKPYYVLDMFPYPSGSGLHMGHVKGYTATQILAHKMRRSGHNVLHPMGWDAFGQPAEDAARKAASHPKDYTAANILTFKKQLEMMGFGYDWRREINTSDPNYTKWTQKMFIDFFRAGLAEYRSGPVNWCGPCDTTLANEEIEDGLHERCGTQVSRIEKKQWVINMKHYAEPLLRGLDNLAWEKPIIKIQQEWIGRREGYTLPLSIEDKVRPDMVVDIDVFTEDPDALVGAACLVIAPEKAQTILQLSDVAAEEYVRGAKFKSEQDRTLDGVRLDSLTLSLQGVGLRIPVVVSEYALESEGAKLINFSGSRNDTEFLAVHGISPSVDTAQTTSNDSMGWPDMLNPQPATIYRLGDWLFARQRFWGEPIPFVHDEDGNIFPLSLDELPLKLPDETYYEVERDDEQSPLASNSEWVNVRGYVDQNGDFVTLAPDDAAPEGFTAKMFRRETDTMPNWAGSSWYWMRYKDAQNNHAVVDPAIERYWGKVDKYVGGIEHAARHLLYARFWNLVLHEAGVVSEPEPFDSVHHVGLVLGADGLKMSKSRGNGVSPDELVSQYGADAVRMGVMSMGDFVKASAWDTSEVISARKFLNQVWVMQSKVAERGGELSTQEKAVINKAIEMVTQGLDSMKFNTAIAAIRTLFNTMRSEQSINIEKYSTLLSLLQPFAPHITEKIADNLFKLHAAGQTFAQSPWPEPYELGEESREVIIMKNGKKIGVMAVGARMTSDDLAGIAGDPGFHERYGIVNPTATIVPTNGRVINFVTPGK